MDKLQQEVKARVKLLLDQDETFIRRRVIESIEKTLFLEVMKAVDYHQGRAAAKLGISEVTFRKKIEYYGIKANYRYNPTKPDFGGDLEPYRE
jgi:DNA-binding protein Fis